ncbi:MAG: hypothetical protein ACOC8D_03055, partial [bacterium]
MMRGLGDRGARPARGRGRAARVLGAVLCAATMAVAAEPPAEPPKPAALTVEALEARRKQVEAAEGLDEALKKSLLALYDQAIAQLKLAVEYAQAAQADQQVAEAAPTLIDRTQEALAKAPPEPAVEIEPDATLAEIEQQVTEAETALTAAKKTLAERTAEIEQRTERRKAIPKLLADARQALDKVNEQLAAEPADDTPKEAVAARRALLRATRQALEQQIDKLQKELLRYEAETRLAPLQRDLAARAVAAADKRLQALREVVNERRRRDAQLAAQKARRERRAAANAHPAGAAITEENARLAELRTGPQGLTARIEQARERLDAAEKNLTELRAERKSAREKMEKVGLTRPMALILRRKRAELADLDTLRRRVRRRQTEMGSVELQLLVHQEQREELADIEPRVEAILAEADGSLDEQDRQDLDAAVREALVAQRGYLDALIRDYERYLSTLADLDVRERELIAESERFADFINEHILWTRSTAAVGLRTVAQAWEALVGLVDLREWRTVLGAVWRDWRREPHVLGLGVLLVVLLLYARRGLRRRLRALSPAAATRSGERFAHVGQEFVLTVGVALPWPLLMG